MHTLHTENWWLMMKAVQADAARYTCICTSLSYQQTTHSEHM